MSWSYFKIIGFICIAVFGIFIASCDFTDDSPISEPPGLKSYSAFYDTTFNVLRAYDCRIVKGISIYYDSVYVEDNEFVIILPPDTSFYFYTPVQRDIARLNYQQSLQSLMMILHNREYFYNIGSKTHINVKTDAGIDVTGYPARGSVTFTNRLNRYAAVKVVNNTGVAMDRRILPAERDNWNSINDMLGEEFGELISGYNYSRLGYRIYPGRDTGHFYNGVSLAFLLHGLMPEYYGEFSTELRAYETDPELYSKLILADISQVCAVAMSEVAGSFHSDTVVGVAMQAFKDNLGITQNNLESVFRNSNPDFAMLSRSVRTDINNLYLRPAQGSFGLRKELAGEDVEATHSLASTAWATISAISQILGRVDTLTPQVYYYDQTPYQIWRDTDTPLEHVNILKPDGLQSYMVDTPVRFLGEAYDSAGNFIAQSNYNWYWRNTVNADYTDTITGSNDFDVTFTQTGTYMIRLSVPIGEGRTIDAGISIQVKDTVGTPPQDVMIIRPIHGSTFMAGQVIHFLGTAWDVEDTLVEEDFEWISSRDGIIGYGREFYDILTTGFHILGLYVTDSDGNTVADTVTLTVRAGPGTVPIVNILSPESEQIFEVSTVAPGFSVPIYFEGTAEDLVDGILHDSLFVWTTASGFPLPTGNRFYETLPIGRHNITLSVENSDGLVGRSEVNIIISTPPVVRILAPDDGEVFPDTIITFQAFARDEEDGILTGTSLEWRSSLLDEAFGYGSVVFTRLPRGNQTIVCRATDSHGIMRADSIEITVEGSRRRR